MRDVEESGGCRPMQVAGPAGSIALTVIDPQGCGRAHVKDAVLFLHPVNLSARCWLPVARLLPDYLRVLPDSRGHGASHMSGPFRIADYAADARAVLTDLGIERVHLVGGSLGGAVACAVAATMPCGVASLVAIGSTLEPADEQSLDELARALQTPTLQRRLFLGLLESEVARGLDESASADAFRQLALDQRSSDLIREITLGAFGEDARDYASRVACPALVMTGELDEACPPEAGRRMAASLRARFEILPSLGHLAMMYAPRIVAERVAAFLREVPHK